MTGEKVVLILKSVGMLVLVIKKLTPRLVGPTKHHDLYQQFGSRDSGTSESCEKLSEMDKRLVKKEQYYQGRCRLENKLPAHITMEWVCGLLLLLS